MADATILDFVDKPNVVSEMYSALNFNIPIFLMWMARNIIIIIIIFITIIIVL